MLHFASPSSRTPATTRDRRHRTLASALLAAVVLAGTARSVRAQATPETGAPPPAADAAPAAAPVEPPPLPPPAAPPAEGPPAPSNAELARRIEQADQQARIASRKIELLEGQLATRPKETATSVADNKGFEVRSSDGANSIRFTLLLQADSRWFANDGALSDKADTFLIRRLRPGFGGTLLGIADYRVTPDFAGSTTALFDAYVDLHPWSWLRLRTGKFKTPLGLERLQNDAYLEFNERALTQNLTPQRDVGAELWGDIAGGIVRYNVGIYNGAPDNANPDIDVNHAKDFAGRILIQPFKADALKELGSLGFHFAVSTGNRGGSPTNSQLPSYKSGGQNTIFSYLAPVAPADPNGTPFGRLRETRLNPAVYYYYGGFGIFGEFVQAQQDIRKYNNTVTVKNRAGHATLSYGFNGKNSWEGVTPYTVLDPGHGTWGALEIAARVNYLKIDNAAFGDSSDIADTQLADPTKVIRKAQGYAFALALIPNVTFRYTVNFEQTYFTGGLAAADKTAINRKTENVFIVRTEVNF